MTTDELVVLSDGALRNVFRLFEANPDWFLYESDIQGVLYSQLFSALAARPDGLGTIPIGGGQFMTTCLAHTEYPSRTRFDVAAISPERSEKEYADWARHMHPYAFPDPTVLPWQLPVCVAVELKCQLTGFSLQAKCSEFLDDVLKIITYFQGVDGRYPSREYAGAAALFVQNPVALDHLIGQVGGEWAPVDIVGNGPLLVGGQVRGFMLCHDADGAHVVSRVFNG